MDTKINEVEINGAKYILKDSTASNEAAFDVDGLEYVVVRAKEAGVFAGYLEEESDEDNYVILKNVRRLWYWDGAASCSQLAEDGVSKPENCRFTAPNKKIKIKNQIEILYASKAAQKSIESVSVWKA